MASKSPDVPYAGALPMEAAQRAPAARARATLARNLRLLRLMIRRDLATRYRGAVLGGAWAVLSPFLMMALYTVVFSGVLRVRLSSDAGPAAFALHLLAGRLPWTAFAEAVGRSVTSLREHQNLVKKVAFPLEVLPLSVAGGALVNHAIALAIYLLGVLLLRGWSPTLLLLPLVILPLAFLMAGVGLILASVAAFLRDVEQGIGLLLTVGLFLTPILYPLDAVPARLRPLILLNPFTQIVEGYRRTILGGVAPDWGHLAALYLATAALWAFGQWWFSRSAAVFADIL